MSLRLALLKKTLGSILETDTGLGADSESSPSPRPRPLSSRSSLGPSRFSPASSVSPMVYSSSSPSYANTKESWRKIYNNTAGKCEWPLPPPFSKTTKSCNFSFLPDPIVINDHIQIVKIPAGTELFHATTIYPKDKVWFKNMVSFNTLPSPVMWFASSADHAKHMNYTHVLKFTTKKEIQVVYIQNIFLHMGSNTGKDLLLNPEFKGLLKHADTNIVGYAGCNECEIAIFKDKLNDAIVTPPELIEERSIAFITGGGKYSRKKPRSNKNRTYCKKWK